MKSRSRRQEIQPISLEELQQSPALHGLLSFLEVPPARPLPGADLPGADLPQADLPQADLPEADLPEADLTRADLPEADLAQADLPQVLSDRDPKTARTAASRTLRSGKHYPILEISQLPPGVAVRAIVQVQDGLSHSEMAVYQTLWRAGNPAAADVRHCRLSLADIAAQASLSRSTLRYMIPVLEAKMAIGQIEPAQPGQLLPPLYAVFSFRRILARWQAAGILGACRIRSGTFLIIRGRSASGRSAPGAKADLPQADLPAPNKEENSIKQQSSQLLLLLDWLPEADASFAAALLERCRQANPAIGVEDIARLCRAKLRGRIIRSSATGFLLSAVPPAAAAVRPSTERLAAEEAFRPGSKEIEWARKTLRNPSAGEWEKQLASALLRDLGLADG